MVGGQESDRMTGVASVALSSHTISSCERNIHPSFDARNPRNSSLFSSSWLFWRLTSHLFCLSLPEQWQPGRIEFRFCFAFCLSPLLIASSGSVLESTLAITIHSQAFPSSQIVSVTHCATSCVRGAHVKPFHPRGSIFYSLLPKSMHRTSLFSLSLSPR